MRRRAPVLAATLAVACGGSPSTPTRTGPEGSATDRAVEEEAEDRREDPALLAQRLAREVLIVDGHIDVPYRLRASAAEDGSLTEDVTARTEAGQFDLPRAQQGGLDAPFMSIYVPSSYQDTGGAKKLAEELIDMVEGIAASAPDDFALAATPEELLANAKAGRITLLMGIENGAALEDDVANVGHFFSRGVRYVTLTHARDNKICDSSYDDSRTWGGLSDFGKKVVREMNRVGMLVDVSHVSDDAFYQVLELSTRPVIASHSSLRHFTPGFERNMSDDMVRALAEHGGVVMINFGSTFVTEDANKYSDARKNAIDAFVDEGSHDRDAPEVKAFVKKWAKEHPLPRADVEDVADHIDRVVELAGIDHVGLGSDFDGVGDTLPVGLADVSAYPNLFRVLLERGYSAADIRKLAGENLLRVWRAQAPRQSMR